MNLSDLIAVARGDKAADLVLKNARIINVFTTSIEKGNVAIYDGHIAGIGDYTKAREVIDLKGDYLSPGFINGHIHIESSMLHPAQYARAVVPHGVTSISTDLHEITNVSGFDGIRFVMDCARNLPLDIFFQAASCVPATHMETSGASIGAAEIKKLLKWKDNIGVGEMMNYPGVINAFKPVIDEIEAARGHVIAGHAPGLRGRQLNAYISAGIYSDHETTELEEGREKLARGLNLMIREGTSEKNLATLLPLVTEKTWHRCMFVVDDRSCSDLLSDGDVDAVIRKAIKLGLDPIRAIQLVTVIPSNYFRLHDLGRVAPGARANLVTIKNLKKLTIDMVFFNGRLVAKAGKYLGPLAEKTPSRLLKTVNIKPFSLKNLELKITQSQFPAIEIIPGQIVTKKKMVALPKGLFKPDTAKDLLKAVVVERHKATGNIGIGIVKGFGLKSGAIASTIAHDSHNVVVVGTNDKDIYAAVRAIEDMHGGLAVVKGGKVIATLPLPVAGLLSLDPAEKVSARYDKVEKVAATLGKLPPAPFAILSFLALPVIPELRLTDMGIVDVLQFKLI
ncbi:MAG: adenine deaminase [Dehalococcoidia bacterium]|nr:adenine deaminase [Dehalococcoidia bacterium]MDD5493111.1 adenine deaminase [Dehalococcoidia bacterium]